MSPLEVMETLLGRITTSVDGAAWFTLEEMRQWPPEAVQALKRQQLLKRGRDANTAVCDGCEEACVLPVHTLHDSAGDAVSFLLCTQRSDTNRVRVDSAKLKQWRGSVELLCDFIAHDLGVKRSHAQPVDDALYPIGLFHGEKRGQLLQLSLDTAVSLIAGDQALPLLELIDFDEDSYSHNHYRVKQLVDQVTTVDGRYAPDVTGREARKLETQARYARWNKAYRQFKKTDSSKSDTWIANQIARDKQLSGGKSAGTIRKQMKKWK